MPALCLGKEGELGGAMGPRPRPVCGTRLACEGTLVQKAAECIDRVRYAMVRGESLGGPAYEYLTEALDALAQVYRGSVVEKPGCIECFGPLPKGSEDGSVCRFCRGTFQRKSALKTNPSRI